MNQHFEVTVREIPNPYIKRLSYRETYTIVAANDTEAKQRALDKFGDWSQVLPGDCIKFDPEHRMAYPKEVVYADDE